ncbi:protein P200 isoform X2 [Maniola jurtina]|uniref:protein P200 isoform X2 n=1 Tax=Maniola jurtina TaxID=191418 RepID=UPI001E68755B|nr:protein P200 isoform X2 [Maniola jurtina]
MGSNSFLKSKSVYRTKSGSSGGSDKDMNGKLKRSKIRRPVKMNDYGMKRIPDYTELAYKEAVSKLRYFLSGNAPSVRSYGGSASIKNLDESDGDLDKKYSTSYNTLSEYKPRPRLTAKYATLYADSLHNYNTPPQPTITTTAPPQPAAGDLSGGTNPDVINFIQKQEEYIEQLERESQYCRDELNNLLGKVKEVISENEHLHEAQKNKLISRMFHSYNAGSETDELDDLGDSTGLDSDNKISPSKTRRTTKPRSTKLEGPNIVFESRISELEAQLTQAKIDLKKVQDENNENKRKLANGLVDSTCLDGFKRQIDNLQRDKSALESQIAKLKLSLERQDGDDKYKRGSDAVENQLREERNNLEMEIRRLKDDLAKERSKVRELAGEGTRRAIQERSAAEQRYNAHFDELQNDLAAQYDNVSKLQLDLERQRREENDLKRELSMKNAAVEELKMELKNKTASLQADLAQAYAEKASLEEELASARLAIERHQRQAKHETNRLNSEIQSLRQRLDRADADLVHSRRENLRLSEQISTLEKELNMKNLTPISPEKKKKEKELSSMLESMENKHAKTVAELESMIQSQNSLMEKLTSECRLLTDKLDDANRRHKKELATLQRQVEHLGRSLQTPPHPPSSYQAPTSHTPAANRIPHTQPGSGPDYTRTESTGDTAFRNHRVDTNVQRDHQATGGITQGHIQETSDPTDNYHTGNLPINPQNYISQEAHTIAEPNYNKQQVKPQKKLSKQNSRESIGREEKVLRKQLSRDVIPPVPLNMQTSDTGHIDSNVRSQEYDTNVNTGGIVEHIQGNVNDMEQEQVEYITEHKPVEEELTQQYDNQQYSAEDYQNYDPNYEQQQPNYEQPDPNYEQQQPNYEQPDPNYEQQQPNYEQPDPNYEQQQANYEQPEQTYEQPQYTEQYENYEQYPQQYVDPNAQYEGQYENYPADGTYTEQAYDNTQYNPEYTEQQYSENVPEQALQSTDNVQTTKMPQDLQKKDSNVQPAKMPQDLRKKDSNVQPNKMPQDLQKKDSNVQPTKTPQDLQKKDSTPKEKVASQR